MRHCANPTSMAPKGKPSAGDESSGNRRGNPQAAYQSATSADEDDGGYPETVMFPPPARGQDQRKRLPRGESGGQGEEYPTPNMAFPPAMAEPVHDGGYPETVMFPPQQPGRLVDDDDGGYPETVMFPPQQPDGQVDDGYQETVQYPPQRSGGQRNERRQYRPPPPPPPFQHETVVFPPRGPLRQWNDGRQPTPPPTVGKIPTPPAGFQPETVAWPPQSQHHFITPPPPRPTSTPAIAPGHPWNSQLFDCCQDSNNAVITAIFPCVTFGQIAEIVDQGQTSCVLGGFMYGLLMSIFSCCLVGATYRSRLRQMYNLKEAPGEEWILHAFCPFCALCQEYRELCSRGLDPSIGWVGNQQRTPPKMPPMHR